MTAPLKDQRFYDGPRTIPIPTNADVVLQWRGEWRLRKERRV